MIGDRDTDLEFALQPRAFAAFVCAATARPETWPAILARSDGEARLPRKTKSPDIDVRVIFTTPRHR